MAYSIPIATKCVLCKLKKATHEVFDRWNGSRGIYCTRCAARRIKELTASEGKQSPR